MKVPLMMNMEGKAVVIGGGNVGMHKLSQLSKFNIDIILIDKNEIKMDEFPVDEIPVDGMQVPNNINANINTNVSSNTNIKFIRAELKPDNIASIIPEDAALVISALEDRELNALVAEHCNA